MEIKNILICIVAVSCNLEVASATSELEYREITLNQLKTTINCTLYTSDDPGKHRGFTGADIRMLKCGKQCNDFLKTCVYHSQQDCVCTMCMTDAVGNDTDAKDLTRADFTLAPTAVIYEKLDADDCSLKPCVNGTCEDKFHDYHCQCNEGYRGKNCTDDARYSCWQAGSSATHHVSAGPLGVWSTTVTYTIQRWQTNSWTLTLGALDMVSVGSAVCGVNAAGSMYCKDGITDEIPFGTGWSIISEPGPLDMVEVSNQGHIWGLNLNSFHRLGTNDSVYGTDWLMVETPAEDLSQLTVGAAGVWGVATSGNIYYRVGTYGDNGSSGSTWQLVNGSAIYIDSEDNYVWICNAVNEVFRRAISSNNPSGSIWERVYGPVFKQISAQSDSIVWGVNTDNTVSSCIENITCGVSYGPYGGGGGVYFDDGYLVAEGDITKIHINVDLCIRLTYGVRDGPCHGGSRGASHTIILTQGEYITAVSLRLTTNGPIKQMQFITNSRDLGWYGSSVGNLAGDDIISIDSNGRKLVYISGRSGATINKIIFHFYCV